MRIINAHTHMLALMHAYMRALLRTHTCALRHTYKCVLMHTYMRTLLHAYMSALLHIYNFNTMNKQQPIFKNRRLRTLRNTHKEEEPPQQPT